MSNIEIALYVDRRDRDGARPGDHDTPTGSKPVFACPGGPIHVTNPSIRPRTDGRMRPMTAKEKLLERVMTLSEAEADEALRLLDAQAEDEWGNLSRVHEIAFGDSMRRLAESERAAGHEPW